MGTTPDILTGAPVTQQLPIPPRLQPSDEQLAAARTAQARQPDITSITRGYSSSEPAQEQHPHTPSLSAWTRVPGAPPPTPRDRRGGTTAPQEVRRRHGTPARQPWRELPAAPIQGRARGATCSAAASSHPRRPRRPPHIRDARRPSPARAQRREQTREGGDGCHGAPDAGGEPLAVPRTSDRQRHREFRSGKAWGHRRGGWRAARQPGFHPCPVKGWTASPEPLSSHLQAVPSPAVPRREPGPAHVPGASSHITTWPHGHRDACLPAVSSTIIYRSQHTRPSPHRRATSLPPIPAASVAGIVAFPSLPDWHCPPSHLPAHGAAGSARGHATSDHRVPGTSVWPPHPPG